MLMIADNVMVNGVFNNNVKFIENLDGHRTYLQDNDEIAIIINLEDELINKELMDALQLGCEYTYFNYGEKPVNMYIFAANCKMAVDEYTMPSQADFTIKMAMAQ